MLYDMSDILKYTEEDIIKHREKHSECPSLTILSTTDDYASQKYINAKVNACKRYGIKVSVKKDLTCNLSEALDYAIWSNNFIMQLPANENLAAYKYSVFDVVKGVEDTDGLGSENITDLYRYGRATRPPCTAQGILTILIQKFGSIRGKHVVIINRSELIGKPLMLMLLAKDATVTVCHSHTKNLYDITKTADIVITATGIPNFISEEHLSSGSFVVDAGIARDPEGKVTGDCSKSLYTHPTIEVTPVPGGVGKLTVLNLVRNCL